MVKGYIYNRIYIFVCVNLEIFNGKGWFWGIILKFEGMFNREMGGECWDLWIFDLF